MVNLLGLTGEQASALLRPVGGVVRECDKYNPVL
jgi:hypothetical protein